MGKIKKEVEKEKLTKEEKKKIKEEKKVAKAAKKQEKKDGIEKKPINKKKIIIIGLISVVVIIVAVVLLNTLVLPGYKYNKAEEYCKNKQYDKAINMYSDIKDFKDSRKLLKNAYFEYGKQLIENQKYNEAIENLEDSKHDDAEAYINYAKALQLFQDKKYDEAITALEKMNDFEKTKEFLLDAYYGKANELFNSGKYKDAITYYEKSGVKDVEQKQINNAKIMIAEEKFQAGNLAEAQKLFKELDQTLEYNNVKVADRVALLKDYQSFINLIGTWSGTNGKVEVRHIYKRDGSWESWYSSYDDSMTVNCKINEDGSVTLSGKANFYTYTNYSSVNYLVNGKFVDVPYSVTIKKGEKIPTTLVKYPALVAPSGEIGYATLTYSNNKFSLSFTLNDKNYSQSFRNLYTSKITYSKKS